MCIIVHKPAGVEIPQHRIDSFIRRNSDGYGLLWTEPSKDDPNATMLWYVKRGGDKEYKEMVKEYFTKDREVLLHCRYATSGPKDDNMAHPFMVACDPTPKGVSAIGIMHNGVIGSGSKSASDTHIWVYEKGLPQLVAKFGWDRILDPEDKEAREAVEKDIGGGNRIVMMPNVGPVVFFNKRYGTEIDGAWYSNTSMWDAPSQSRTYYGTPPAEDPVELQEILDGLEAIEAKFTADDANIRVLRSFGFRVTRFSGFGGTKANRQATPTTPVVATPASED